MKKQVLIMCFALLLAKLTAQTIAHDPKISIDSMLINVDKSNFTSDILYDRIFSWAGLASFNETTNSSNIKHFEQALNELHKASNQQKLISYKDYRKKYTNKNSMNVVDIGIINVAFDQLNYNEANENKGGLRLVNNMFEPIEGKQQFLMKHVLIVAPLKLYAVGPAITYNIDESFLLEESRTKKLTSLTANFDNGRQYQLISNGKMKKQSIAVHYNKEGYKTLRFTATYQDGSSQTTYGTLHVKIPAQYRDPDPLIKDSTLVSTIPFQGYDETAPIYGELEYRVFYHTNNGNTQRTLLNPS